MPTIRTTLLISAGLAGPMEPAGVAAQAQQSPSFEATPVVLEHRVANGLRLLVVERPGAGAVAVRVLSVAHPEPDGKAGISIMEAELRVRATRGRPAAALQETLRSLGHGLDFRMRFTTSPTVLDSSLAVVADVIRMPAFEPQQVEQYRANRLKALSAIKRQPLFAASDEFWSRMGQGQVETPASVATITRDDLLEYHARRYAPSSLTMVVVGDVRFHEVRAMVERHFGGWASAARSPVAVPAPRAATQTTIYLKDSPGAAQAVVWVGQRLPAIDALERPVVEVLNNVIGGLPGSRLYETLREREGLTYSIRTSVSLGGLPGGSAFYGYAEVDSARAGAAIRIWLTELRDLASGSRPVTTGELEAGRGRVLSFESPREGQAEGIADRVSAMAASGLSAQDFHQTAKVVAALTPEGVTAVARRIIDPDRSIVVVVGDRKSLERQLRSASVGPVVIVE